MAARAANCRARDRAHRRRRCVRLRRPVTSLTGEDSRRARPTRRDLQPDGGRARATQQRAHRQRTTLPGALRHVAAADVDLRRAINALSCCQPGSGGTLRILARGVSGHDTAGHPAPRGGRAPFGCGAHAQARASGGIPVATPHARGRHPRRRDHLGRSVRRQRSHPAGGRDRRHGPQPDRGRVARVTGAVAPITEDGGGGQPCRRHRA